MNETLILFALLLLVIIGALHAFDKFDPMAHRARNLKRARKNSAKDWI